MKITKWTHKGNWSLQKKTITVWEAVCPRCGAIANYGYTEDEAVAVAEEDGWSRGLCPDCQELRS